MGVSLRIGDRFKTVLGTVLCVALSAVISLMGQTKPGKSLLPIWFLAVIMVIVFRFGTQAGIWGTLLSGMIFAAYLFEPIGSLAIHNEAQKEHLMWMVLVGLAISIFGHRPDKPRRSSEM